MPSTPVPLDRAAVIHEFAARIPHQRVHMLHWFAAHAADNNVRPFVTELAEALATLDRAWPSLAIEFIERLAAVRGIGEVPYEGIIQILSEIYVVEGAIHAADLDPAGNVCFGHEPGIAVGMKNPECEACASGHWFSVEVKTPRLIEYGRQRAAHHLQITARFANSPSLGPASLPRDNPIKDFLVSAESKFVAYRTRRPVASTILSIVWDDFVQEAVAALCHPNSGLLTERSFLRDALDQAIRFPSIDGVLLIRHQHQIMRATREEPLGDGQRPFTYHGPPFPPKALIHNPHGSPIPDAVIGALGATPIERLSHFAEYRSPDLILWVGGEAGGEA